MHQEENAMIISGNCNILIVLTEYTLNLKALLSFAVKYIHTDVNASKVREERI